MIVNESNTEKNMNVLVFTDNESSEFVRILYRKKHTTFIRRNILSTLELLKHQNIDLLVIDRTNIIDDLLEFVLNANDVANSTKIFVHSELTSNKTWNNIKPLCKFIESIRPDFFDQRLNEFE